ncbi:hypothetical protein V9L05_17170 [Bernardetia sp. Wsw4-3y2]|uniref:hypothetical protein n=1 Tax=Bernardetia sp. Wsw4-3y2 TaxID=3127471 RepID=UPI0030D3858E
MPTYRVYLAYPTTPELIWNWAETMVRRDAQTALQDSYDNWVASNPNPLPPPLAECRKKVDQVMQEILEEQHDIH